MKARVFYTRADGVEDYADFTASTVEVLNESTKEQLKECFWFEFGDLPVDGIIELPEVDYAV